MRFKNIWVTTGYPSTFTFALTLEDDEGNQYVDQQGTTIFLPLGLDLSDADEEEQAIRTGVTHALRSDPEAFSRRLGVGVDDIHRVLSEARSGSIHKQ